MKKFKNVKKKLGILFSLSLILGCESAPKPLQGEKISIFNKDKKETVESKKIILERPYINKSWTSNGGNNENNIGHIAGKKSFNKLYSNDIGSSSSKRQILYTPVANEKMVFTISGNLRLTATDINTGKTVWYQKFSNNDLITFGAIALNGNDLYLVTNNSQLVKLNATTGEIIYSKYFNTTLKSGLIFCSDKLFFVNDNNEAFAIDSKTGKKIYVHKTIEENSSFIKGSTPACKDDKLVVTFSNGEVHMIMADTSTPIWLDSAYKINPSNINTISDIIANPVINGNIVIAKSYNDITKAFDLTDGKTLWFTSNGGKTTPVISNEIMFDINNNKVLFASNLLTGNKIWEVKLDINKKDIFFDPLLVNNQILIPVSNGDIIKVNPYNGKIIETENLTSQIDVSPIVINDKLIIISNGDLEVFN
ncbi:MAG: PQQ-binding-like beta-propeller repeat protein [Alphaproteobacteria bacterium]|nr:PQQ-binding-like beta-propeller repeat protein [Alphaproteobacteria bacterium]